MTVKHGPERRKGTPRAWVARYMRLPLILASIACSLVHANEGVAGSSKAKFKSKEMGLQLSVEGNGWGGAQRESIETVLYSVADELLSRLPKKLVYPIVVSHTNSNPVALYDRGPNGEYLVHLHARGEKWHLYAYEFAHEMCHILSNYDENVGAQTTKYNQWFEETLCETASLFALKNLASTWESSPPEQKWAREAKLMRRFFDHLISEGHRQLPAHTPLASWLQDNEARLRDNPYLRNENDLVANLLLPLFQADPQNWTALNYLNLDPTDARTSLRDYLHHWYKNAPTEHKTFIANVLAMFKLNDVVPVAMPTESLDQKKSPVGLTNLVAQSDG